MKLNLCKFQLAFVDTHPLLPLRFGSYVSPGHGWSLVGTQPTEVQVLQTQGKRHLSTRAQNALLDPALSFRVTLGCLK